MHNIEKYDQSISAGIVCSVYYRLGETMMGRLVSIKRNVSWPGLVNRSQEDLSAVGSLKLSYNTQESHAVAGKPRDAAVNSDRYRVRWHFAGAISVSRMQSVSGCTVYA